MGEDIYPPVLPFSCNLLCACLVGRGFSQHTADLATATMQSARHVDIRQIIPTIAPVTVGP